MRKLNRWLLMAGIDFSRPAHWRRSQSAFWCPAEGVSYGVSLKHAAEHIVHVDAVTHQPAKEFQLPVWNALYEIRDFAVNVNHVKVYEGVPEWLCDRCDTLDGRAEKSDKTTWSIVHLRRSPLRYFQLRHDGE